MTPEGQNGDRPGRSAHRDHSDSSLANGSKRRDHEGRDRDYESRDKYSKSAQRHRDEDIRDRRSSSDRDRCLDRDWSRYSTDSESRVVDHNDLRSVDRRHGINTSPRGGGQRRSRSPLVRDELGAARHHDSASSRAGYPETDRRKVSAEHTDGNRSALSQCESIPLRRDMSIDEAIEIVQTAITKVMNSVSRTDCSAGE